MTLTPAGLALLAEAVPVWVRTEGGDRSARSAGPTPTACAPICARFRNRATALANETVRMAIRSLQAADAAAISPTMRSRLAVQPTRCPSHISADSKTS